MLTRPPSWVRRLSPSPTCARRAAGAHAGVSFRCSSATPPSVTSWAGSSRGCAHAPEATAATRTTPPRTAAHKILGTLRPPWTSVGVPNSVARADVDTSQTPGPGSRARRARTRIRVPTRCGGRGRSSRRARGLRSTRGLPPAGGKWLAAAEARRSLLEEGRDALVRVVGEGHQRDQLPEIAQRRAVLHVRHHARHLLGEPEGGGRVAGERAGQPSHHAVQLRARNHTPHAARS